MSLNKNWKPRLLDMQKAVERILDYKKELKSVGDLISDSRTLDACIRNFQILGEAAKHIPPNVQKEMRNIPWREIKGMRNILVHEYFGASEKIIWKTIKKDLPDLYTVLSEATKRLAQPVHNWKICPPGEIYVKKAHVDSHFRSGHPVKEHLRSEHCRESNAGTKDILSQGEIREIAKLFFDKSYGMPASDNLGYGKKGNLYDEIIGGWVKYWNEVFKSKEPLDPNVVKALIATESSFDANSNRGKRRAAKGLMQLLPQTMKYLKGEKSELKNNIFEFEDSEIFDPNLNISAGVRWLFRKRETASARLKRQATWEEAVSEYKDYLRRKLKNPSAKQTGMDKFRDFMDRLKKYGK